MKVAFIGVGNMGRPMAANIAKGGHELAIMDLDAARASAVAKEISARCCAELNELTQAEVIVTMLPDGQAVQSVLLGEGGIAESAGRGTVCVDMSSSQPLITRQIGGALQMKGISFIDAPVSGGVERATKGTLSIMIGSDDPAVIPKVRPVLACMGSTIFEVGKLGAGHAVKALNNVVAAGNYAVVAEAMAVAEDCGIDPETFMDVINVSTGQSFISTVVMKKFFLTKTYDSGFKVGLLAKDAGIAADLSANLGCVTPFLRLTNERWRQACEILGAGEDHSKAALTWETRGARR